MSALARNLTSRYSRGFGDRQDVSERLSAPADSEQLEERLARAKAYLDKHPIPLTYEIDCPENFGSYQADKR